MPHNLMASLTLKASAFGILRFHVWVVVCVRAALGQCSLSVGWNEAEVLPHHTHQRFSEERDVSHQFGSFSLSSQHFTPFISVHTDQIIYSCCTSASVMRIWAPVTVILINITPACFLSDQFTAKLMMLLKMNVPVTIPPIPKHNLDHFSFRKN